MRSITAVSTQPESRFSRKRALILKAAAHAFGRKGFHATTLEEIAADLKVTKASLYYYFSTKEELLFEVHLLSLEDLIRRVERIVGQERSPAAQLQAIITEHLRVLASDYEGAFLLQQEYELPQKYREEIIRLRDRYEHMVLEVVQEGSRQRVFRVKDPRIVVRMMLGAVNWFLRWYRADGRLTVDEIADAYVDYIFYGLLAPAVPGSMLANLAGDNGPRGQRPRARARRRSNAK
jgi:AcrR family transcriptional regulator